MRTYRVRRKSFAPPAKGGKFVFEWRGGMDGMESSYRMGPSRAKAVLRTTVPTGELIV